MGEQLAVREAARIAGVDGDTIRRWCDSGRLAHFRTAGNQRRIDRDALESLLTPGVPRRAASVDPLTQIGTWASMTDEWAGWEPGTLVGETALRSAEVDLRGLIRNLGYMLTEVEDELDRR